MAQIAQNTAREVAKARRQASYSSGKAGLQTLGGPQDRTRAGSGNTGTSAASTAPRMAPAQTTSRPGMSSREAGQMEVLFLNELHELRDDNVRVGHRQPVVSLVDPAVFHGRKGIPTSRGRSGVALCFQGEFDDVVGSNSGYQFIG